MRKLVTAIIALLFILFYCTSCGPAAKLRRAERLIAKAESQGASWHSDTLWRTIEIPVPEVKTDTVFESVEGDTVLIEKDRLQIKYVRLAGEKVYIEGKCKQDTIRENVYYKITKTIKAESWLKWWYIAIAFLLGGFIVWVTRK